MNNPINLSSIIGRIATYSSSSYSMQYDAKGTVRGYYLDKEENVILILEAEDGQLIKKDIDFIKLVS